MIELEKASFDDLKNFSSGKLWVDAKSLDYLWVDSVQKKEMLFTCLDIEILGLHRKF